MTRDISPLRIVMVDDDKDDLFLTKMSLKRASFPTEFIGLESGKALFEHIKNRGIGSIDLVLLDLNMPIHDGHDILAELSAYPHFSELRVVMFSTSKREIDKSVSENLGATSFIVKPSTVRETRDFIDYIAQMFTKSDLEMAC